MAWEQVCARTQPLARVLFVAILEVCWLACAPFAPAWASDKIPAPRSADAPDAGAYEGTTGPPGDIGGQGRRARAIEDEGQAKGRPEIVRGGIDVPDTGSYIGATEPSRTEGRPSERARLLYEEGKAYQRSNAQEAAVAAFEEALELLGSPEDTGLQSRILRALGIAYRRLHLYPQAIESQAAALRLDEAAARPLDAAKDRANLGSLYLLQGRYAASLRAYRRALETVEEPPIGMRANLHNDIGLVLSELADFDAALGEFQAALALIQETEAPGDRARLLHNMAFAYFRRGVTRESDPNVERSIEVYLQALPLRREAADRRGESKTLNSLGFAYARLGRFEPAMEALNDALEVARASGDRANAGRTLDSIGTVELKTGRYDQALEHFHEALVIAREVGDRGAEHVTLKNIGQVFAEQGRPDLAIAILKDSVNVIQRIRKALGSLPADIRKKYADSVAETYRLLADLLLRQGRASEARKVVDLLRIEELDAYVGGMDEGGEELVLGAGEKTVTAKHARLLERALALGLELTALEDIHRRDRTPEQSRRIRELRAERAQVKQRFERFKEDPDVVAAFDAQAEDARAELIGLDQLPNLSEDLAQDTAILYPLILEDRLELILATAHGYPSNVTRYVGREALETEIDAFRTALLQRSEEIEEPARQLYRWLVEPLEGALQESGIKTIVYIPDGRLRYVPLAALHDGQDWLIRRYAVDLISALSLTDFKREARAISDVLAGAFTADGVKVDVGGDEHVFAGLKFARSEVDALSALFPESTELFVDEGFTEGDVVDALEDFQLVHLATHAVFLPGRTLDESFILFGHGESASLMEVRNSWSLRGVELIVLSACETGVGGKLGNGEEIHGFGYLMQKAGANAVVASLWKVSDGGTFALMKSFYRHLMDGVPKARALQQAQLALIDSSPREGGTEGGSRGTLIRFGSSNPQGPYPNFTHPFYWAAFLIIGNGL